MYKLSYKFIVKVFAVSLAAFFVLSVMFVDELGQESTAAEFQARAELATKVKVGAKGQISSQRSQVIEEHVKNINANVSQVGVKTANAGAPTTPLQDCSNNTYLNLTELHAQTRLIYNMVPKCASLGIRGVIGRVGTKLLQGNYNIGTDYMVPFHHKEEDVIKIVEQDINSRAHKKVLKYVYQKHLHFTDFSVAGAETPYYVNVIRDPVEHHISLYYYQRERGKLKMFSPWHLLINSSKEARHQRLHMSYDECVQNEDIECSSKEFLFTIIPFFCGQDIHCLVPSERSIAIAKRHVMRYYPVVGYVENLGEFFRLAEVIWPQFFKGSSAVYKDGKFTKHKTGARKREPSSLVKSIMTERLGLEYEFYNWIKQRFHCLYQRYVDSVVTVP